jgi:DNA-binding FadR family transcriptional regulator
MIVDDILNRGIKVGAMLPPESEMLEEYDIGRGTLREALRLLEVQGLISMKSGPGGGPVVVWTSPRDLGRMATLHFKMAGALYEDLLEARLILEPIMAGLAAQKRDPAGIATLATIIDRARREPTDDDDEWHETTRDFHYAVSGISGNPVLDVLVRALKEIVDEKIRYALAPQDERAQVKRAHEKVTKAIEAGRSNEAEKAMRSHMVDYLAMLRERHPTLLTERIEWE